MDRFIPLTILIALRFPLQVCGELSLYQFLLPDRDNKRCHLSDELQKLAYNKASLSPVQSICPLSAAEALTSVMAWAGRKSSGNLPSFTVGVVAVLWSWWQAAKGVSIQQEQLWGCTGFLLCFWQSKVTLPSHLPAPQSCVKDVVPGAHWPSH